MQSLSEVPAGEACTIKWMFGEPQIIDFLHRHDMKEGSLIQVLHQQDGATIVGINSRRLALGNGVADRIKV